ncbi:methyltransferase [Flavisolibacter tropicus]|uniref:Uncharacterized protein n=1 Tax=Flavisolibacter tropicus TaxID=1492898 RepID=A0A172TWE7_9BACT|nr:methyltransferase [Flavisolibacter tropicus]ANE51288.1 hypothetical protein SY85_12970 [Flavisolibacter tropicus]
MNTSDPFSTIQHIAGGYCLNRCLHAVAELGVADVLDDTPQTTTQLAQAVGANPDALSRVIRLLAAYQVFEMNGNKVSHSPASYLLRQDHPQSMRSFARMFGLSINWKAYEGFYETIQTGQPSLTSTGSFWEYFATHEKENHIFNAAMADKAKGQIYGILGTYDFSAFNHVGDIGGGRGHLLMAILKKTPNVTGILFDLPHVIDEVKNIASDRLSLQAGDFFKDDLPECDAYVVMEIIHDWPDAESIAILKAIRKAAPTNARLLLIETLVPENAAPDWSKMLDIHMLTLLGGRQRTQTEYSTLLGAAGFKLNQVIDTGTGIAILEATPS